MKKLLIIALTLLSFTLFSCNKEDLKFEVEDESTSLNKEYLEGDYNLAKNIQDGVILHAWNWSYNTIKANLKDIAESGYTAVQTSPVQQPKGYNGSTSVTACWWKVYQPVSFSIGNAWYGSKEDLTSLCTEAEKYGIKIICDIVSNHMANVTDFEGYSKEIEQYEPQIYNNTKAYFHSYKVNDKNHGTGDSSIFDVVQGCLSGLPDLNTASEYVQECVIDLLKECVDCGVSGFRFDAAKHIETPDDGAYASNFWPNVLNTTSDYAMTNYNKKLYYYGEILNDCGSGREIESYTKFMSVTDNTISSKFLNGLCGKKADDLVSYYEDYDKGNDASKIVLWTESHDTYADDGTSDIKEGKITRTWSLVANRLNATALYFARPGSANMGDCGSYEWMSQATTACNIFHNQFIGATEEATNQKGNLVVERYREGDDKAGVIITNVSNSVADTKISVKTKHLKDGIYYDQVSGNKFTVRGGTVSGTMTETGIVVLYRAQAKIKPQIKATQSASYLYSGTTATLTLDVKNATKVTYSINGGEEKSIKADGVITVNQAATVCVKAYGDIEVSKTFTFETVIKKEGYWCIANITSAVNDPNKTCYAWVWDGTSTGSAWREVIFENNCAYIKQKEGDLGMLLAVFDVENLSINDASWDLSPAQTEDYGGTKKNPLDDNVVYKNSL